MYIEFLNVLPYSFPLESKMSSPKPLVRPPGCSITPTVLPLAAGRTTSSPAVRLSPVNSSAVGSSPGVLRHSGKYIQYTFSLLFLFYFILFYFILFYFILFYFILFHFEFEFEWNRSLN